MDDEKEGPGKFFYAATGKVYEGEWVEDQPKCGEYREPHENEKNSFHPAAIRKETFTLPEIGLEAPHDVLETATTTVRMDNAERRGITSGVVLTETKVSELKGIYHSLPNSVTGLVALGALADLFGNLGLPPLEDPAMMSLFQELELTHESEVTFAEAIDIAQYLLQF